MKLFTGKSKIVALALLLTISLPEIALSQPQSFGQTGRAGQNGQHGSPGRNGQDVTVFVEKSPLTYELAGQDGGDGTKGLLRTGVTENDHVYTLTVGRHFSPWLKSGYLVRYEIVVTQETKMGAVYTQRQEVSFVAP